VNKLIQTFAYHTSTNACYCYAEPFMTQVCGSPDVPLYLLKSVCTHKGISPNDDLAKWLWEVLESFSNEERSLFLRFVWGRTRLPRTLADFRGRDFVVQVCSVCEWSGGIFTSHIWFKIFQQVPDKYHPPDHYLPESYTCFFMLKLPRYSCKVNLHQDYINHKIIKLLICTFQNVFQVVLEEKLKYAIHFCKSIDTDEYARIDLADEELAVEHRLMSLSSRAVQLARGRRNYGLSDESDSDGELALNTSGSRVDRSFWDSKL